MRAARIFAHVGRSKSHSTQVAENKGTHISRRGDGCGAARLALSAALGADDPLSTILNPTGGVLTLTENQQRVFFFESKNLSMPSYATKIFFEYLPKILLVIPGWEFCS